MLINYTFNNFRSFKNKAALSMVAGKQRTFNENMIRQDGKRILPSAVIYGANASGKSNIIMSMAVMSKIVTYGSLDKLSSDVDMLETYPFAYRDEDIPMEFEMEFSNHGEQYLYKFAIIVEHFQRGVRKIVSEHLDRKFGGSYIEIFDRNEQQVHINKTKKVLELLGGSKEFLTEIEKKLNSSIDSKELFLCSGFKSVISSQVADEVIDFFKKKMMVVSDFTLKKANLTFSMDELPEKDFFAWNHMLKGFVRGADFGPQEIAFRSSKGDDEHSADMKLVSIYHSGGADYMMPAELMESRGTLKLIDFAIPFQRIFTEGGVLVLDEFDAAIHPEIIKGIIALFHDSSINKKKAQLIFTTHNPIYLNNKIFRRDQILFVEKDPDEYESAIFSLADFGSVDVRNDQNYLINYFKGKYSTLPFIDFAKIFNLDGGE